MKKRSGIPLFTAMLAFLAATASVTAAVPNPPLNFHAVAMQDPATNGEYAHLSWSIDPSGDLPLAFKVMEASGDVRDLSLFAKDALVSVRQDSVRGTVMDYEYDVTGLPTGTCTFCVIASNNSGLSAPSAMQAVTLKGGSGGSAVRFLSSPPTTGIAGIEYLYDADAEAAPPSALRFRPVTMPSGSTLDSLTGMLRYTAPAPGQSANFKIRAEIAADPSVFALQYWTVFFNKDSSVNPRSCAVIGGMVLDQNGNPAIGDVWVKNAVDPSAAYLRGVIQNGSFAVPVPDSSIYVVKVSGPLFVTEWYKDASTEAAATPILVHCGDSTFIAMRVQTASTRNIGGRVFSATGNTPLPGVKVVATSSNGQQYGVFTDKDGAYSLTLPEGEQYVLSAIDLKGSFETRYYNDVADPSQATVITLGSDMSGIDFHLLLMHFFRNGIAGTVQDSAGGGVFSKLILYRLETIAQTETAVKAASALTDSMSQGNFSFANLLPGEYLVYAYPFSRELVPGYYKAGAEAVPDWMTATRITVDSQSVVSGLTVLLRKRSGFTGNGTIHGTVSAKVGGIVAGGGTPLPEATVFLYDASGKISDYSATDESGYYELREAPEGSVTLVVDKAGYRLYSAALQIVYGAGPIERPVEVQPYTLTSVGVTLPLGALGFTLAPNPSNSVIRVTFDHPAETTGTLTIYDILGALVHSAIVPEGAFSLPLDFSSLPAGDYIALITIGKQQASRMFNILR